MTDGGHVEVESGVPYESVRGLMQRGHVVRIGNGGFGGYQAIATRREERRLPRGQRIAQGRPGRGLLKSFSFSFPFRVSLRGVKRPPSKTSPRREIRRAPAALQLAAGRAAPACCCTRPALPGDQGCGVCDQHAVRFLDFLQAAGHEILAGAARSGPTGYGDSPYQCYSAFAGNPYLVDLAALVRATACWRRATSRRFAALSGDQAPTSVRSGPARSRGLLEAALRLGSRPAAPGPALRRLRRLLPEERGLARCL